MAKITYASLKLKVNTDAVKLENSDIEVLQYLPMSSKYEMISMVLEKSYIDGVYDPVLVDLYFHLYLVYMYSNISFTDKQREDEVKLYDVLQSNNIITAILGAIPEDEYISLMGYLNDSIKYNQKYKNTVVYLLNSFINDMPKKINDIQNLMEQIDQEKFDNAINFAKALNGGREI